MKYLTFHWFPPSVSGDRSVCVRVCEICGLMKLTQWIKTMSKKRTCPAGGGCGTGVVCSHASRNTSSLLCTIVLSTNTHTSSSLCKTGNHQFIYIVLVLKSQDLRIKCINPHLTYVYLLTVYDTMVNMSRADLSLRSVMRLGKDLFFMIMKIISNYEPAI